MNVDAINMLSRLTEELGAQIEALRAAVFALASQSEPEPLATAFDAATELLQARQQGRALPDSYLEALDQALAQMRIGLRLAAGAAPPSR